MNTSYTQMFRFFRNKILFLSLMVWAAPVVAQPTFTLGRAAGPIDEPLPITLDFDDGGVPISEFALSIEYDPAVLYPELPCDFFLRSANETHHLLCTDHPSLGSVEISLVVRGDIPEAYPSGNLGELRLTSISRLNNVTSDQSVPLIVSSAIFVGVDGNQVESSAHKDGVIHVFPNWPLDDSDAVDTEPEPVLPPFDGLTRRLVGGGFERALTFHSPEDEDWLGLPGNGTGQYEVKVEGRLHWQIFDMGVMGSPPPFLPRESGDNCTQEQSSVAVAADAGATLLRLTPCNDLAFPSHYEVAVSDRSLFAFPTSNIPIGGRVFRLNGQSAAVVLVADDGTATYSDPDQGFWDMTITESALPTIKVFSNRYTLVAASISANPSVSLPSQSVPITGETLDLSSFRDRFSRPVIAIAVSLGDPIFLSSFEDQELVQRPGVWAN
ncbi:MAG: hypothetical protein AAGA23_08175 [Pseudomonadota bacterium]